jgi:hypothetical protein
MSSIILLVAAKVRRYIVGSGVQRTPIACRIGTCRTFLHGLT